MRGLFVPLKHLENMKRTSIGLNTILYEFPLTKENLYKSTKQRLKLKGVVIDCFINNRLAFEFKPFKTL